MKPLPSNKIKNLCGNKYSRLTVIDFYGIDYRGLVQWLCKCSCGKKVVVLRQNLQSGTTKSCGCLKLEKSAEQGRLKLIDLTGQKFGRLTVIRRSKQKGKQIYWRCKCDCGTIKNILSTSLKSGGTISCGCFHKENHMKHGMAYSSTYTIWEGIIQRCNNPKNLKYNYYGGRGITVCKRWLKFENFFKDMGERPGKLTIERINNNKGYCKSNCCWATRSEQQKNRRPYNHRSKINGQN